MAVVQEESWETYQTSSVLRDRAGWTRVETVDVVSRRGLRVCVRAEGPDLMLVMMHVLGERREGESVGIRARGSSRVVCGLSNWMEGKHCLRRKRKTCRE